MGHANWTEHNGILPPKPTKKTNPTIGKLDDIVQTAKTVITNDGKIIEWATTAEQDKQRITAWALGAVGSDEPVPLGGLHFRSVQEATFRNQLRAEIRAKLTGGKP